MNKFLLFALSFLMLATGTRADVRRIATITITNAPTTNGMTLVVNGDTRYWTNNAGSFVSYIQTNNTIGGVFSNLYTAIAQHSFTGPLQLDKVGTNTVILRGVPNGALSVSVTGEWASVALSTNPLIAPYPVSIPVSAEQVSNVKTVIGSGLVEAINTYATNTIALNRLTNTVQSVINGSFSSSISVGTSATIGTLINAPSTGNTSLIYNLNVHKLGMNAGGYINTPVVNGGLFTNGSILVSPVLTNGINYGNAFSSVGPTGAHSEQFGESASATNTGSLAVGYQARSYGLASVCIGYQAGATNDNAIAIGPSALAYGNSSTAVGEESSAEGFSSVAIGSLANASFDNSVAIGAASDATNLNSVAIGYHSATTTSNQVMIGTSLIDVVVNHNLSVGGSIVSPTLSGNTTNNSIFLWSRTNNTGLANGLNQDIALGTAQYVYLSGPSLSFTNCGLAGAFPNRHVYLVNRTGHNMTIANESAGESTPANRIQTGIGSDITVTNNPGTVELFYDSTAARWVVF